MPDVLERPANQMVSTGDIQGPRWSPPQSSYVTEDIHLSTELWPIVRELEELITLPRNWNSYGAAPVTITAIDAALRLLSAVGWTRPLPTVSPTQAGGVQFEWGGDEEGVEIEFGRDGTMIALIDAAGGMEERRLTGPSDPFLAKALSWAAALG